MDYFNQESERLSYRKLTYDDAKSWEEFFVNNNRIHFLGLDPKRPKEELAKETIARQLKRYEEDKIGLLAVIEKKSGDLIGLTGLISREVENKKEIEIGYSFKAKYWGNGYATEAAQSMKTFGLNNEIAKRFISIIHKDNTTSFRVAERNGMKPIIETNFMGMDVIIYGSK